MTLKIGYCITGSFCNFDVAARLMQELVDSGHDVTPIMSFNATTIDTRFGTAVQHIKTFEKISGKPVIKTIEGAEPIGPKSMFDVILVCPCTGNTAAKITYSIIDTPVVMAVKSHLRNGKPVVIALASNDILSNSAKNLGQLLNIKNIYIAPLAQDNPETKPRSMVFIESKVSGAVISAMSGAQIQPLIS